MLKMIDLFQEQIYRNETLSQDEYDKLINKNYHCGEPINVGDKRLWAFLQDDGNIKLISLKEEHINLYCDGFFKEVFSVVPTINYRHA